jgi:hypothetical protein
LSNITQRLVVAFVCHCHVFHEYLGSLGRIQDETTHGNQLSSLSCRVGKVFAKMLKLVPFDPKFSSTLPVKSIDYHSYKVKVEQD